MRRPWSSARRAVELYEQRLGFDHADTLKGAQRVGWALYQANQDDEARQLYEKNYEQALSQLGPAHEVSLAAHDGLACSVFFIQPQRAIALHEENLKISHRVFGPSHEQTLTSLHHLARAYRMIGRHEEAVPLLEDSVARRRSDSGYDPYRLLLLNELAEVREDISDDLDEDCVALIKEVVERRVQVLGINHPDTRQALDDYFHYLTYNVDGQAALCKTWIDRAEHELGFANKFTQYWYGQLLTCMFRKREPSEVIIAFIDDHLDRLQTEAGPEAPETLRWSYCRLGKSPIDADRFEEALALGEQFLESYERLSDYQLDTLMEAKLGAWPCSSGIKDGRKKLRLAPRRHS